MSRLIQVLLISLVLQFAAESPAQTVELGAALKHLPGSANSLAIVKVDELMNSPRGKKEEWAKKHQSAFLAGSVQIPPAVSYLVRAFEFHPEDSRVSSSYGVAGFKVPVPMTKLAEHEHGKIQMIAGKPAVFTTRNTIFTELQPGLIGGIYPSYRQDLARWLRTTSKATESSLSPYLNEVVSEIGGAQVVMALDFEELVDPRSWRERIKSSTAVSGKENAVKLLADLADSLRGISLKIEVKDTTTATIVLNFGTVVSQTAKPFLKPVVVDLIEEAGAALEDLNNDENVKVDVAGKTATISFPISDSGLRHVLSMIIVPNPADSATGTPAPPVPEGTEAAVPDPKQPTVSASRTYYAAVNQVLDDLEVQAKKPGTYNKTAVWHDNFAKKIDQLPITGVDPELLEWGGKVADNLRALAVSLRGVPITVKQLQGELTYSVDYQPGGYRPSNWSVWSSVAYQPEYVNVQTNQAAVRAEQAKAVAAGAKEREQVWSLLASDRQAIRVKMQAKYGRDFSAPR